MKRTSGVEEAISAKKMPPVQGDIKAFIDETINNNVVAIFALSTCPFCKKVVANKSNVYYHDDYNTLYFVSGLIRWSSFVLEL